MRIADIKRNTKETRIELELNIDGSGKSQVDTGVGFLNHMLSLFAKHSGFDLKLSCKGDIEVDNHHTIEDIGICLGQAIGKALIDKTGLTRYGNMFLPMDEALCQVTVDLSSRSYLVFNCQFEREMCGDMETEMVEEFFRAVSDNARITLHINMLYGKNTHHKIEAIFKGFGQAMKIAAKKDDNIKGVLSTKGVL